MLLLPLVRILALGSVAFELLDLLSVRRRRLLGGGIYRFLCLLLRG